MSKSKTCRVCGVGLAIGIDGIFNMDFAEGKTQAESSESGVCVKCSKTKDGAGCNIVEDDGIKNLSKPCEHEYGSYKGTRQLWCSGCGVELDLVTRKPIGGGK